MVTRLTHAAQRFNLPVFRCAADLDPTSIFSISKSHFKKTVNSAMTCLFHFCVCFLPKTTGLGSLL